MLRKLKIGILALGIGACCSGYAATEDAPPSTVTEAQVQVAELQTPTVPTVTENKEAEIPVQLEAPKKTTGEGSIFFKALAGLLVVGVLAAGGFVMVGKYRRSQIGKSTAPEIKILRQHYLGPKKSLAIIRVAGESMLIGMTDHNISMIKSLSLLDDDVPDEIPQNFQTVFQKTDIEKGPVGIVAANAEENEDFSISGIRDFVSTRLKNMRSLD